MKNFTLAKAKWSKHREKLKPVLDIIGLKANDPAFYANIDKACSNEWAFLFLAPDGFVILRPRQDHNTSYIEITAGYCNGGNAINKYQQQIISLARMGNARYIEFLTIRKGASKVAVKFGWKHYGYHEQLAIWRYQL